MDSVLGARRVAGLPFARERDGVGFKFKFRFELK
jgi:hypothetical protein